MKTSFSDHYNPEDDATRSSMRDADDEVSEGYITREYIDMYYGF